MRPMPPKEFLAALERLGFIRSDRPNDLGHQEAARLFGVRDRAVREWSVKGPPPAVALCLRLMLRLKLTLVKLHKLMGEKDA